MGSIITGLLILTICGVPFVLMNRRHRKKEKAFLNALQTSAPGKQAKISRYDSWTNAAIGLDATNNTLFFTRQTMEGNVSLHLNLNEIQQCKIERTNSDASIRNRTIDRLELYFIPLTKEKPITALAFYNANCDGPTLTGELQLAEKWCNIINTRLALLQGT